MPLLRRVALGGFNLGAESYLPCQQNCDLKRKFSLAETVLVENDHQQSAKRHCDWTLSDQSTVGYDSTLSATVNKQEEEDLPGCLKDIPARGVHRQHTPFGGAHRQHTSFGGAHQQHTPFVGAHQQHTPFGGAHQQHTVDTPFNGAPHLANSVTDIHRVESNMESDAEYSNPLVQQSYEFTQQQRMLDIEHSSSTGHSTLVDQGSSPSSPIPICGLPNCRGQKASPVSGRLNCHCSASWRGMYGMDIGYFSDYY